MNASHQTRPEALKIGLAELAAHTPATLSEMIQAVRRRGFRLNEIEMAPALGALIDRGKAEILPPPRLLRRNARKATPQSNPKRTDYDHPTRRLAHPTPDHPARQIMRRG